MMCMYQRRICQWTVRDWCGINAREEKQALAVVEAVKKWEYFFAGRHFIIVTVQRSV